jgi:hypothetical protein
MSNKPKPADIDTINSHFDAIKKFLDHSIKESLDEAKQHLREADIFQKKLDELESSRQWSITMLNFDVKTRSDFGHPDEIETNA